MVGTVEMPCFLISSLNGMEPTPFRPTVNKNKVCFDGKLGILISKHKKTQSFHVALQLSSFKPLNDNNPKIQLGVFAGIRCSAFFVFIHTILFTHISAVFRLYDNYMPNENVQRENINILESAIAQRGLLH